MHHMLHHLHIHVHVEHVKPPLKLMAVSSSVAMLLLGGLPGWLFYLSRRADPWGLVSRSSLLRGIHSFLWNRWYMNPAYYAVFVDGLLTLKDRVQSGLELPLFDRLSDAASRLALIISGVLRSVEDGFYDPMLNVGLPWAFIQGSLSLFKGLEREVIDRGLNEGVPQTAVGLYHRVKRLQTGVLSYNILYIALVFTLLILLLIWLYPAGGV